MSTLTVTARGQVTFRKDVLAHLGITPGDKIQVEKLPNGRVALRAARPTGTIDDFIGFLAGKTEKVATLEEIEDAITAGWSGQVGRAARTKDAGCECLSHRFTA